MDENDRGFLLFFVSSDVWRLTEAQTMAVSMRSKWVHGGTHALTESVAFNKIRSYQTISSIISRSLESDNVIQPNFSSKKPKKNSTNSALSNKIRAFSFFLFSIWTGALSIKCYSNKTNDSYKIMWNVIIFLLLFVCINFYWIWQENYCGKGSPQIVEHTFFSSFERVRSTNPRNAAKIVYFILFIYFDLIFCCYLSTFRTSFTVILALVATRQTISRRVPV